MFYFRRIAATESGERGTQPSSDIWRQESFGAESFGAESQDSNKAKKNSFDSGVSSTGLKK